MTSVAAASVVLPVPESADPAWTWRTERDDRFFIFYLQATVKGGIVILQRALACQDQAAAERADFAPDILAGIAADLVFGMRDVMAALARIPPTLDLQTTYDHAERTRG